MIGESDGEVFFYHIWTSLRGKPSSVTPKKSIEKVDMKPLLKADMEINRCEQSPMNLDIFTLDPLRVQKKSSSSSRPLEHTRSYAV